MITFAAGLVAGPMTPAVAAPNEGEKAPELSARQLNGGNFSVSALAGQVLVLNFWATWCLPCRAEMPALDAYYRRHYGDGLRLLAISMDDPRDEPKVRALAQSFAFPTALARDTAYREYGRIWRLPLTFVIDRDGILRKDDWYGDPGLDEAALEAVVTPLLLARRPPAAAAGNSLRQNP